MSERVPGDAIEACGLVLPARCSKRGLRGLNGPHELATDSAISTMAEQFVWIGGRSQCSCACSDQTETRVNR